MELSNVMTVLAPRSPVVQEANFITMRFTVYGLGEATEAHLLWILWTSGRRNVEAICIMLINRLDALIVKPTMMHM